jgi:hypothetical protein
MTALRSLTPLQRAALLGSFAILFWSVPGLIVNPDFSVGSAATSKRILGVDMNGWHAVSGFLIVVPCLLALRRPPLLAGVLAASAGGLIATAVWALLSNRVAGGLFVFPHQLSDALLHLMVSAIFLVGALRWYRDRGGVRRPTPA